MAMTADSEQGHHQNSSSGGGGDAVGSPSKQNYLPAPWAQVVRGEQESSSHVGAVADQSGPVDNPSPEGNNGNNAGKPKKAAWKKPSSNGVSEVVMGAVSWPALSESTKPSHKSSPSFTVADSSPKAVSDADPLSISQGPEILHSPQKQATGQSKSIPTQNHTFPARQRSMKRGSGGSSSSSSPRRHSQNSFTHPPQALPSPSFAMYPMPPNGFSNLMPDHSPRGSNWEPRAVGTFFSQPHGVINHRHSPRKANLGSRGDVPHRDNSVGRRDHDVGHHGNARDANVQRGSPRGFVRSPRTTTGFVQSQAMGPYNPIGYPDFVYCPPPPMEPFRSIPYLVPPLAPQYVLHVQELLAMLNNQIEYYFSDANLFKDDFLKSNMDDQGWVPITLIAGFNRVKSLTNNIQLIVDSLRTSIFLEVQDDKVRRRNDWIKWIPSSGRMPPDTGSQSLGAPSYDALTTTFQNVSMEDVATDQLSTTADSSLSMDVPGGHFSEHFSQKEGNEWTRSS